MHIRKSEDRGHFDFGWLDTYHTFSFGDYHDPDHMGFRSLRVINQDFIDAGKGFPQHGHKDMEIISYVVEGALAHEDSLGNKSVIKPFEVQKMSAGTGIRHSEYNHSKSGKTQLLQIWVLPSEQNLRPSYDQKNFEEKFKNKEKLFLVASPTGEENTIKVSQDLKMYVSLGQSKDKLNFKTDRARHTWIQVVKGTVRVKDQELNPGDAMALSEEKIIPIETLRESEILIFDLTSYCLIAKCT